MDSKKYKNLEITAKCNTLLVLADDFKQGGGKATLLSMYFFLKENRYDRDLFIKLLNQIPDHIVVHICKFAVEIGDGEFQSFITHHKLLAGYKPQPVDCDGYCHIGDPF